MGLVPTILKAMIDKDNHGFNILQCCIRNSELAGPVGSNCLSADRVNLELKEWIF